MNKFREPYLENMERGELIELIRHMGLEPSRFDIARIMWETEKAKTKNMRDEATTILHGTHANFSAAAHAKRMAAHSKFDKALARENEAYKFYFGRESDE